MTEKPYFQFRLSTALVLMNAVAILFAAARWHRAFPSSELLAAAFFVAACISAQQKRPAGLAWGLMTIGWLVVLAFATHWQNTAFDVMSGPPPVEEMRARFLRTFGEALSVPLFLSLPAIYLIHKSAGRCTARVRNLFLGCVSIAILDAALITVLLYNTIDDLFFLSPAVW